MINQINASQSYSVAAAVKTTSQNTTVANGSTAQTEQSTKVDTVEIGTKQESSGVYSNVKNNKLSETDIAKLQAQADATTENLRRLVQELILKQNQNSKASDATSSQDLLDSLGITTQDVENAQDAISEDGEYGVEAVSNRLVDFAISVSGGDKSKLSELISAIDKGFAEASKTLGGELPDISQQTYDATIKKLNAWASSESSETGESSEPSQLLETNE
jgi:hypothetical protein